jgi:inorganic pyrophosphatase
MPHLWHDVPAGPHVPQHVTAIVEIPGRSRNKFELDKRSGGFRLDRVLYSAVHYPGDYGFIPQTLAEDGDPLDVLVLIQEPTFSGCLITVRPIGILQMRDRGAPDAKVLAVPAEDPSQNEAHDLGHVPAHSLREIAHFFEIYKDLEGKRVDVTGWAGRDAAHRAILRAVARYADAMPSAM